MASENHPVVVFLDDIQWADTGSRLLIQTFINDTQLKNIMIILAYRDEDLTPAVETMLQLAQNCIDISLARLDAFVVHQIVTSILGSNREDIQGLSNLITKRSSGNPFHVKLLMELIQQQGFLRFDEGIQIWIFSLDEIQTELMVSETLADLLVRKIERLSPTTKETLKFASFLGYRFSRTMLLELSCCVVEGIIEPIGPEDSGAQVLASLSDAVTSGFIESTNDGYNFTHDKLQAAFQSRVNKHEGERLHLLIGNAYLATANGDKATKYNAVVHLNCAPGFLAVDRQKSEVCQLNLEAAKYCDEKSAFVETKNLLLKALATFDSQARWSDERFNLTFEIMQCLARTQLILGDFVSCKETVHEALQRGKTIEMKVSLLLIEIEVCAAQPDFEGAVITTTQALALLGVKMPHKISIRHVIMKFAKIKVMLRRKSNDDLISLPLTQDFLVITAIKLLMYLFGCAFSCDSKETAILSALLAIELTLTKGLAPYSPFAVAIYGIATCFLGNSDQGYQYGKLALALLDKLDSDEAACPTVGFSSINLIWWKEPLREIVEPLHEVGKIGLRCGDMLYGPFCLSQSFATQLIIGTNLKPLEKSLRETYTKLLDMGHTGLLLWYQPYLQYILKLRSDTCRWEDIGILSGEIMNETTYFQQVLESKNPSLKAVALRMKVQEAVFFNQFELAVSILAGLESLGKRDTKTLASPNVSWLAARAYFEHYETTGQRRHLRKGRKYMRVLERMDVAGCPNAAPYLAFLNVEAVSRRRRTSIGDRIAAYNEGIACMAENGFVHLEGLLNERAGFDFAQRERHVDAYVYFRRAVALFRDDWGSVAKAIWLRDCIGLQEVQGRDNEGLPRRQCIAFVPQEGRV